ncbi:hypothetical protein HanXRQr2_Chr05g0219451 [Helianthus annuus]|uniref:Uncharacterized protein n=1 Tax=Helianthus annuus TaxID=4232 RepID=A0A9K3J1X0_HELAN|nr:hypothetical protein HanXRQr2_Chr05g0219451 [Helianthus annuus]
MLHYDENYANLYQVYICILCLRDNLRKGNRSVSKFRRVFKGICDQLSAIGNQPSIRSNPQFHDCLLFFKQLG